MKSKISVIILVTILFIPIVFFITRYLINYSIIKNEEKQIILLQELYNKFVNDIPVYNDSIVLDDSCLKNLVTRENFSSENIEKLKTIERKNSDSKIVAKLYRTYDSKSKSLILKLKVIENEKYYKYIRDVRYNLYIENGELKYKTGLGTSIQ